MHTYLDGLDASGGVGGRQGRPPAGGHGYLREADAVLAVGAAGGGQGPGRQAVGATLVATPGARGRVQEHADALLPTQERLPAARGLAASVEQHPEHRRVSGYARAHLENPKIHHWLFDFSISI